MGIREHLTLKQIEFHIKNNFGTFEGIRMIELGNQEIKGGSYR